jgi:hypothetical protein
MIRMNTEGRILLIAALIVSSACQDQSAPTGPVSTAPEPDLRQASQGPSDDPIVLGRSVPGFGGFYFDAAGIPTVYLRDPSRRRAVAAAMAPFFQAEGVDPSRLRVLKGNFDYAQLDGWFAKASPAALVIPGVVFADLDEASNRLRIGVEHGAALAGVRSAIARLGIPAEAVIVEQAEPIQLEATLRDKVRPVLAGLQINFTQFICTLGFNATRNGQNSFITASHCTTKRSSVDGTKYYQPLSSTSGSFIGTEVADPPFFTGGACPAGKKCRYSDAARAAYASGVSFTRGRIEKTSSVNTGNLTISGNFSITAEGGGVAGNTVNKVGRTTGWSRGRLTNTCVNTNVFGTNITMLCQNWVQARVSGGDSGSPVFIVTGTSSVKLAGILWGGSSDETTFVYSPILKIEQELGSLTTF